MLYTNNVLTIKKNVGLRKKLLAIGFGFSMFVYRILTVIL